MLALPVVALAGVPVGRLGRMTVRPRRGPTGSWTGGCWAPTCTGRCWRRIRRLNVHELRAKIDAAFGQPRTHRLNATVVSFGYKYGLPLDADLVADCRFLPNPHWVEELRPYTGRDPQVRDYVLAQPGAREFLDQYAALLHLMGDGFAREGKRYLTLAVGCTGGKHRSVAIAEQVGARLAADGIGVRVVHRDLGRE